MAGGDGFGSGGSKGDAGPQGPRGPQGGAGVDYKLAFDGNYDLEKKTEFGSVDRPQSK